MCFHAHAWVKGIVNAVERACCFARAFLVNKQAHDARASPSWSTRIELRLQTSRSSSYHSIARRAKMTSLDWNG